MIGEASFENGICIQKALLIKDTGDIYYNDISSKMYTAKSLDNLNVSNFNYVQKYNISDFVTNYTEPESQNRGVNYSFIRSKSWYDDFDVWYFARLYGGTDMYVYEAANWAWNTGTALSLVIAAIGLIPGIVNWIYTVIGVVGGLILQSISVKETYRDYYWKYMINQVYTDRYTAYSTEYLYQREKRYTLNDGNTDWEQIYYSSYYGSSAFWEELVNNIGYYFIF